MSRYLDSDEDDDLDGFIDDGEDDIDYSAAIRDIFGYDKSRSGMSLNYFIRNKPRSQIEEGKMRRYLMGF